MSNNRKLKMRHSICGCKEKLLIKTFVPLVPLNTYFRFIVAGEYRKHITLQLTIHKIIHLKHHLATHLVIHLAIHLVSHLIIHLAIYLVHHLRIYLPTYLANSLSNRLAIDDGLANHDQSFVKFQI